MGVVGVKTGVKPWSEKPNTDQITKSDNIQSISAADKKKVGDENVGSILNKISDPNWIDPQQKMRTVGNDKLDKDAFMKLMLAQMKNQDPTNPLKSHEMAAQLAQFSGVEQMTNINQTLSEMRNSQKPQESFQALNFIGKAVAGDSAKLVRIKGDRDHDFSFTLGDDAGDINIRILDSNGEVVRNVTLHDLKKGENKYQWNGQDERGQAMPAGEYKFFAEAKSTSGKKIAIKTEFEGTITGVNYTPEGPILLIGTQSVKLKDVKKIVDPNLLKSTQKSENSIKDESVKGESIKKAGEAKINPQSQIINSVGMSNGMMTNLGKELSKK